jgi:hypothetical protein
MPARSAPRDIGLQGAAMHVARRLVWAVLVLAIAPGGRALRAEEGMTRESRIVLIRGLLKEIAVTKVALPRSGRGVTLTPTGINKEKTEAALRAEGVAIKAGLPVEITKISFKSDDIVFELNGGHNRGKKWYQHIEITGGVTTRTLGSGDNAVSYGSVIHLTFPNKLPNVSLPQVKQMLSVALDFERHLPTVAYSPTLPPKVREAIKNHQILVGMDRDAVLSSKGQPERKVRETKEGVEFEDWIYGLPPHVLMVTFDGDTVSAVNQY